MPVGNGEIEDVAWDDEPTGGGFAAGGTEHQPLPGQSNVDTSLTPGNQIVFYRNDEEIARTATVESASQLALLHREGAKSVATLLNRV